MKALLLLGALTLLGGCAATETIREACDIDAAGQKQVMEAIAARLPDVPNVNAEQYIKEPFKPATVYNGKDSCTFIVRPWQPIDSELIWDGTLGFHVNKSTLAIESVEVIE
jgi:hypothetical protein